MKYLATIILASALAPVALGDRPGNVVCCLPPPAPDVDPRTCRQSFAEPACNEYKDSCEDRGTFRIKFESGDWGNLAEGTSCKGGGALRCVRKGAGIPPSA
ncbi:hypothetical protein WAI453_000056 [Rhynchosporium graminicola]